MVPKKIFLFKFNRASMSNKVKTTQFPIYMSKMLKLYYIMSKYNILFKNIFNYMKNLGGLGSPSEENETGGEAP